MNRHNLPTQTLALAVTPMTSKRRRRMTIIFETVYFAIRENGQSRSRQLRCVLFLEDNFHAAILLPAVGIV